MIQFDAYEQFKSKFESFADNDFSAAFELRKSAAAFAEYYGCCLATIEKELSKAKKEAEAKQAEVEVEHLSQEKVAKRAEKKANSDPRILQYWQPYFQNIELKRKLEAIIHFCDAVYFVAQSVYERGTRQYAKGGN